MQRDDDRMFWFDLARHLGFPHPQALVGTLTAAQLQDWKTWLESCE
jgi:hypothetical protein